MSLSTQIAAVVASAESDAITFKAIVNGPATGPDSEVDTDNGPVKTAAAKILEIETQADDIYVARDTAVAAAATVSGVLASLIALTALTGGGAGALDSLVTDTGETPIGFIAKVTSGSVGGGDLAIQDWILQAGTNAEDGISYVRPDDYAPGTNEKVWVRVG